MMLSPLEVIDRGVFSPCEISLKVSGKEEQVFSCHDSLRLLTGRRLTCQASSGRKQYVVKIFPRRSRSMQEYEAEVEGYGLLHNASFNVPARVFYGDTADDAHVIIYQYLSRVTTLLGYAEPDSQKDKGVLNSFLELIIQLHRDHFVHEDPHLGNFLVKGKSIYVLDTGAVRRVGNVALLAENFALFIAQFPVSWHIEEPWVDQYLAALHPNDSGEVRRQLEEAVRRKRAWRERHILKKIYRECTGYHVHSSIYGKMIIKSEYSQGGIGEMISMPGSLFEDNEHMLKEGNSSTVGIVHLDERDYVVKRYNIKNIVQWLKRLIGESRASRSWKNAHRLLFRGIATARPVAIYECMKGNMKGVSVIAMEYLDGTHSADFFRDRGVSERERKAVAARMLEMLAELKKQRISHGDLKSTNFILVEGKPCLVDLDALRLHKSDEAFQKYHAKDMDRFRRNWVDDDKTTTLFDSLYEQYGLN